MPNLTRAGHWCFAIAIVAFGIQHFLFGYFTAGRAPAWPEGVSGQLAWAYFSGAILIATGAAILTGKWPRYFLLLSAAKVLVWALFRHVPILVAINFNWGGELTQGGKALTLLGGLLAVAASLPKETGSLTNRFPFINRTEPFVFIGRFCLGIFMIIAGIEHFIFDEFVQTLVPAWIPGPYFWTYFAGVALIAGGAGLMLNRTLRLAATLSGAMIFIWFVVLHVPRGISINNDNEWISVIESLCFSGIAFVLAGVAKEKKTI